MPKPLDTKKTKGSQILSDAEEYLDIIAEEEKKKKVPPAKGATVNFTPNFDLAGAAQFLDTNYGTQGGQQEQEEIYGPVLTGGETAPTVPPVTDPPPEQQTSYAGQALQQGLTETQAADPTHIIPPPDQGQTGGESNTSGYTQVTLSTGPKAPTVYSQYNAPTVKVSTGDSGKEYVPDGEGDYVQVTPDDKPPRDTGDTDTTTDTGAGAGAGTDDGTTEETTESTPPVMTYEDWLADIKRQQEEYANRQYEISQNAAQEQYGIAQQAAQAQADASRKAAASEYERAVNDAQNAYAINRAGYGSRGESLGRNGLAMSGYSDYADQAAYAASRGEMYAAGANRFAAEQNADMTYRDSMLQADLQKSAANANAELAKEQGIASAGISYKQGMAAYQQAQEEAQAKYAAELEAQKLKYSQETLAAQNEYYKDVVAGYQDGEMLTDSEIDALVTSGQISQDQGNSLKQYNKQYQDAMNTYVSNYDKVLASIDQYGDINQPLLDLQATLDSDYNNGSINLDTYRAVSAKVAHVYATHYTSTNYKDVQQTLKDYLTEGKLTATQYHQAIADMQSVYKIMDLSQHNVEQLDPHTSQAFFGDLKIDGIYYKLKSLNKELTEMLTEILGLGKNLMVERDGHRYYCNGDRWMLVERSGIN